MKTSNNYRYCLAGYYYSLAGANSFTIFYTRYLERESNQQRQHFTINFVLDVGKNKTEIIQYIA